MHWLEEKSFTPARDWTLVHSWHYTDWATPVPIKFIAFNIIFEHDVMDFVIKKISSYARLHTRSRTLYKFIHSFHFTLLGPLVKFTTSCCVKIDILCFIIAFVINFHCALR
jgi:hypothetical protein